MQSRLGTSADGEVCNAIKVVPPFLNFIGCLPIGLFYPQPGFCNKVVAKGLPELTGLHAPFFLPSFYALYLLNYTGSEVVKP